jgi:ABC-type amino acid transport substrate-binding protein
VILLTLLPFSSRAQQLTGRYNSQRPVVITCDWDKPPYEFLNDNGEPAGSNVDVMKAICKELHIPCKFTMKEWGGAIKTFERGEADIILANTRRYTNKPEYFWTNNIINYNRIVAASTKQTFGKLSIQQLVEQDVVLKPSDFTIRRFLDQDSSYWNKVEFQSPKVAIM